LLLWYIWWSDTGICLCISDFLIYWRSNSSGM